MAKELTINYANDEKFQRDINEVAEAWNYEGALIDNPSLTKKNFIERTIKDQLQLISKQSRIQKAFLALVVED